MKKVSFIMILLLICTGVSAQGKFFIQAQVSPKITVNSNTGLLSNGRYSGGSNVPDGRSALAFGIRDYSLAGGYRVGKKSTLCLGIGMFSINQIFRPDRGEFQVEYKNIHKYLNFITIPISFEYLIYSQKKFNLYGGVHLSFIGDVFPHKNNREREGNLRFKNGDVDTSNQWFYSVHYLNMKTFNFLYGFSMKCEYRALKKVSVYASAQMMQGFRPLITSFVSIIEGPKNYYSPSISTTNGQSIMVNLGLRYYF